MKGVILAGGLGTRLSALSRGTPKCLVPVREKPMLEYVLEFFSRSGISEVGIIIHEDQVPAFTAWKETFAGGVPITFFVEKSRAGTFGCLRLAKDWIGNQTFVTANGDCLMDFDVGEVVRQHKATGALVTVALVRPLQSGTFVVPKLEGGLVQSFERKSVLAMADFICSGFQIVEPRIFAYDPGGEYVMMEDDVLRLVCKKGLVSCVKLAKSRFVDCGTPESLTFAREAW